MLEITNKRSTFSIKNEVENIALNGECTVNDNKMITNFSGSFNKDNMYIGGFYYSENENGKINKNLNDITAEDSEDACKLIDITVKEIKENI